MLNLKVFLEEGVVDALRDITKISKKKDVRNHLNIVLELFGEEEVGSSSNWIKKLLGKEKEKSISLNVDSSNATDKDRATHQKEMDKWRKKEEKEKEKYEKKR